MEIVFGALAGVLFGFAAGYLLRRAFGLRRADSIERKVKSRLEEAEGKAKEMVREAEKKAADLLLETKEEHKKRQEQLTQLEARLLNREEALEKRAAGLEKETGALAAKEREFAEAMRELQGRQEEIEKKLEGISGLSRDAAREELFRQVTEENRKELAELMQKLLQERRDEVERQALEVIVTALQRYARTHIAEATTTLFPLSDEDVKGKIIGREGRNIRALERATGVEFVIDETPDSIVISSFDPFRREVARLALDKLIKDGRIQPVKIEEKVEEARQELSRRILEIGEAAAAEVGVYDLPKEILQLLGRLHFRTSFGQNVLTHSIEMAHLSGMIAAEIGVKVEVAKKGALLHDIGKALDQEVEGTHVEIGRKILKKYGVDEAVIEAMQSHHEEYPYASPEAYVVTAADALSAARPGARRGTLESYLKRLSDLEKIAKEFPGVQNAYALSAGREIRIFVMPDKVDDFGALELAKKVANRIQSELKYPGEIKVNVIRELRAVEYAR